MVSYEASGSPMGTHYKVRIQNNHWTFITTQGQERESASYYFQLATHVQPRAFEWTSGTNSTTGWVGSYKLESNKLTIIFGTGTLKTLETRPTDFDGRPTYRMALERAS